MKWNIGKGQKANIKKIKYDDKGIKIGEINYPTFRLTYPSEFLPENIKNGNEEPFFIILNLSSISLIKPISSIESEKKESAKLEVKGSEMVKKKEAIKLDIKNIVQGMLNETSEYLNSNKVQLIDIENPSKQAKQGPSIDKNKIKDLSDAIKTMKQMYLSNFDNLLIEGYEIKEKDIQDLKDQLSIDVFDEFIKQLEKLGE